jgi:hypothetical protein
MTEASFRNIGDAVHNSHRASRRMDVLLRQDAAVSPIGFSRARSRHMQGVPPSRLLAAI